MLIGSIDGLPPSPAVAREGVVVSNTAAIPPAADDRQEPLAIEAITHAVVQANKALRVLSQAVEFEYDQNSQVTVVRLIDTEDHQVLRQIPSREMLEIANALERMQTMLVRSKA